MLPCHASGHEWGAVGEDVGDAVGACRAFGWGGGDGDWAAGACETRETFVIMNRGEGFLW